LILILVLKPILIFLLGVFFGYSSQVSFMSGIYLAQISEFSLILVTGGLMIGDITGPIFSLVVLMMAISVIVTSYFVQHAHGIYGLGQNFLEWFEKLSVVKRDRLEYKSNAGKKYTVLIGCGKMGTIFIDTLRRLKQDVRVLDNNPEVIKNLVKRKLACTYGDSTSRAVLDSLKLKNVKILISTIPDLSVNQFILSYAKQINPKIIVILTTNRAQDVLDLYDLGADYVIVPRVISGENMSEMLSKLVKSKNILVGQRKNNIKIIEELQDLGLG